MNLSTIEMTREEAEQALAEWGEAVKTQKCTPEDEAIAAGYRELAKGRKLIALSDTIRSGGEDEHGRPRLAVAPSSTDLVFLHRSRAGTVAYSASDHANVNRWDFDLAVTPERVILRRVLPELDYDWRRNALLERFGWKAMVPVVPPRFRARGWRSCHVLFEAEWAEHTPPAPIDPALIRHLRGDLWVVRGVWDLSPLERAVLMERNRA